MCKFNPKNDSRFMDPCMIEEIKKLEKDRPLIIKILACCCGHKKYSKTIICKSIYSGKIFDLVSGVTVLRKKKFYKKDKAGCYYVPEVVRRDQ